MRSFLVLIILVFAVLFFSFYCESKRDPYEIGTHLDYSIECENGFIYKISHKGTIQVLNSDGTPLKCGKKIY